MRGLRRPIEVVGELGSCAVDSHEPAHEPHAQPRQNAEVEVAVVGAADQLQRRLAASCVEIASLEGRIVKNAGRLHPGVDVLSAVAAGHARVIPDGERHRAPRGMDLLGELSAARRGADHQHAAIRKLPRLPVVRRRQLGDPGHERLRHRRTERRLAGSRRDNDGLRAPLSGGGRDAVSAGGRFHLCHFDAAHDGRGDRLRVKLEIGGECAGRHEGVGIAPVIRQAGKNAHRVGRQQVQRAPALRMPPLADPPALQHHMVDAAQSEASAHRQAGLAAADDDDVSLAHDVVSLCLSLSWAARLRPGGPAGYATAGVLTATETGTPLVRMSKTADRAFDCMTIFSS